MEILANERTCFPLMEQNNGIVVFCRQRPKDQYLTMYMISDREDFYCDISI